MHFKTIKKCRICSNNKFDIIIDLGEQYIANAFHKPDDPPILTAPLELIKCTNCHLIQLSNSINRDLIYKTYWYKSGINQTMRDHLRGIALAIQSMIKLEKGDKIIDIGCNDSTLLSNYPKDIIRIGIDPSNIKPDTADIDIFINDYFTAERLRGYKAKVITSIAMFYDLDDPRRFVQDIKNCLTDDGIWVLELSYMPSMLRTVSYDTICAEHLCYYTLSTFQKVLENTGLEVFDVEFNDINGGSFRLFVSQIDRQPISVDLQDVLDKETEFNTLEPYNEFAMNVKKSKDKLLKFLEDNKNHKIYGYGASTKGQIILQYCNITSKNLVAIAERNPLKYDLYTPGTNIRICSEEEMRAAKPDYLLVFPWYFMDEFVSRERDLLKAGCHFVKPLPKFEIL